MKTLCILSALALASLTACSTTSNRASHDKANPETVMVTYHVKAGSEKAMQDLLSQVWEAYRKGEMAFHKPHVVVMDKEDGDKPRIVEVFTWVNRDMPDHAPAEVKKFWGQEVALCEARNGHGPLEGGEVDLIAPAHK